MALAPVTAAVAVAVTGVVLRSRTRTHIRTGPCRCTRARTNRIFLTELARIVLALASKNNAGAVVTVSA